MYWRINFKTFFLSVVGIFNVFVPANLYIRKLVKNTDFHMGLSTKALIIDV